MLTFISDSAHYNTVLDLAQKAKKSLWIGTADIKDLLPGNEEIHAIEASVEASLGSRTEQLVEQIKKEAKGCFVATK